MGGSRTKGRMQTWVWGLACAALTTAACNSGEKSTSGATGGSGTTTSTGEPSTSGTTTTAVTSTSGTTASGTAATSGATTSSSTGGGPTCNPTAGTATLDADCDLLQLAIMQHDGAPTDVLLTGRVFVVGASMSACAVIDGVDVVSGQAGSSLVQHLGGGTSFVMDGEEHPIASASPAASDFVSKCASDLPSDRFEGYGIVVHGHADGGTFTAQCARASNEGRWPPALRLTCHKNVDEPVASTDATEQTSSFMGMTFTSSTIYGSSVHQAGGALTSANGDVFVIPLRDPFDPGAPLSSHDTTGWMGSVSEQPYLGGTASQIEMLGTGDLLGTDLCPAPPMGMPTFGPPVFLARVTGMGGHGAYSTEMFVTGCIDEMIGGG